MALLSLHSELPRRRGFAGRARPRSLEFTFYEQRMGKGEGKSEKSKSQDWIKALEHERQYKLVEEPFNAFILQ